MDFINANIPPDSLPAIGDVQFYPLDSRYLQVKRIALIISMIVLLIIGIPLFFFIDGLQEPLIIWAVTGLLIFVMVLIWVGDSIGFKFSGYALRDKDLLFRRGWLVRKVRVVPLNRVQHVSVQSGPVERRFGLASVSVFTAGAGSADFTIRGITEVKAQQIKEWISNQLNETIN